MVEVTINGTLPEFIEFLDEEGNRIKQAVQFEWKPVECLMCKGMGHVEQDCPNHYVKNHMHKSVQEPVRKPVQHTVQKSVQRQDKQQKTNNAVKMYNRFEGLQDVDREEVSVVPKLLKRQHLVNKKRPVERDGKVVVGGWERGLFGLIETKVKAKSFGKVFANVSSNWSVITNYSKVDGVYYGVWVNVAVGRESLWKQISEVSLSVTGAWVICGDFNNILNLEDRLGSPCCLNEVEKFRECLRQCDLMDFKTGGSVFTYTNKQQGTNRGLWITVHVWAPYLGMQMWKRGLLVKKLKAVKGCLKNVNMAHFSNVETADAVATMKLQKCQERLFLDPENEELIQAEIMKAKLHWLNDGDVNSTYFHACLRNRKATNRISSISLASGEITQDPSLIASSFHDFYIDLLGTYTIPQKKLHPAVILEGPVLNSGQKLALCRTFREEDIKSALRSIDEDKAPGLDGFLSRFNKTSWNTVKSVICKVVLGFFEHGKLLKQVCTTTLTLIPKTGSASQISHFRPIACCNVVYKIISKMICSRLKEVLPAIIDECQGAFVAGRSIMDNILICQDMLKDYNNKRKSPRCTIKVDLRKAYDFVHWDFIRDMLVSLGFPDQFVHWIMVCVSSPTYSLLLNGGMHGFFRGKRGVRQGDPMSSLLFVIVMEYLARLLKKVSKLRSFMFHYGCKGLHLNHMIFADDLMLFAYGDRKSVDYLIRALTMFEKVSGLKANSEKTAIYFGNVNEGIKQSILDLTGFVEGSAPFRYLGIPLNAKYLRVSDFDVLIDKMLQKLMCWSRRNFSYYARAQCVLFPKAVIQRINQLCRAFLWSGSAVLSKAPSLAWTWVCKTKKFGGLGMRDCERWNKAALGKYVWQIAKEKDSLWVKWAHDVYIKSQDWWSYSPKKADGWAWKKICKIKEELKMGFMSENWTELKYSIAAVYNWSQGTDEKVNWTDWIWSRYNIPKTAFITWLEILNKLRTRDMLFKHGIYDTDVCLFCDADVDCRELLSCCCVVVFPVFVVLCVAVMWLGVAVILCC
ncbi:uncharacterized protein LOC110692183 [Chenopodium quinoa]|uniref:uncharacterized protein LOC110692183 n=1 Tax=Chenopodium quinoa TaxID=63459 RepID=UPI000B792FFF|nr:uncharacterized protein LOC110692183 [Chenopodium quinoa]